MQVKDRRETDIDCGGGECYEACLVGRSCASLWDCRSKVCTAGLCAEAGTCFNGIKDGRETELFAPRAGPAQKYETASQPHAPADYVLNQPVAAMRLRTTEKLMSIVVAGVICNVVLLQAAAATAIVSAERASTVNVLMQQPAEMPRKMATKLVSGGGSG
eukprot:gene12061-12203_t